MSELANLLNKVVSVLTNDGKRVVGTLKGFDQVTNLILENSHERIYCKDKGVEVVPMGLFIIRGDNLAVVGELDMRIDAQYDLSQIRADPLNPIIH